MSKNKPTSQMKILHVITDLDVGGAEFMLLRLLQAAQTKTTDEHVVVSLTSVGVIGEQLKMLGIPVYSLNMKGIKQFVTVFSDLRGLIKSLRPDLMQTWLYHADFLGGLAARSCGLKHVVWGIHSTEVPFQRYPITWALRSVCAVLSYFIPSAVWFVADRSAKKHRSIGYDRRKFIVIPNGFDLDYWTFRSHVSTSLRIRIGVRENTLLIGSVGRYNPDKDHDTLLRAFVEVCEAEQNTLLVLVGSGLEPGNVELMKKIQQLGIASKVVLLGPQSDLPEIMSGFDLFCLHSRTEAFPLVLGEAMALGLLCVTTDVGDSAFLLQDTDQVVPAESPKQLAKAVLESLRLPPEEQARKRKAAQSRVSMFFSLDLMLERVRSMYVDVMRKAK
jgi:glycosyltransferase involved in cell wall biosynthesis